MTIVHVGNMANKGTQALLVSDVAALKAVAKEPLHVFVSTVDIKGTRQLGLDIDDVVSPLLDVPYERADSVARSLGWKRGGIKYSAFAASCLMLIPVQMALVVFSSWFVRAGLKAPYRSDVFRRIENSQLIVSCSDENFKESSFLLRLSVSWIFVWWSMLISRTMIILTAKFLKKPVVLFPNSIGPFRTFLGRAVSRLALNNCNLLMARERYSYNVIDELNVRSPRILTSDTALLYPSTDTSSVAVKKPFVAVCAGFYAQTHSSEGISAYVESHAKALSRASRMLGFRIVFLPHYVSGFRYDDLEISELIRSKLERPIEAEIINTRTLAEFKSILDQADFVLSSKMHPAVLAASSFVPTLYVAYDNKQLGFFQSLGMPKDCAILISEINEELLFSGIEKVWSSRKELGALLSRTVPFWQDNTKRAIGYALNLSHLDG